MANWGWSTGASGYDDEDRLVSWTRDDNNLSQSWTLTKEGDWSQFVENTTTENRTHGPAHELTAIGSTALSYDPKGNLTVDNTKNHKYTWDFDNRMSAADTDGDDVDDVTLKYDALGRRVAKASGSATVVYVSMTQPIQYSPFAGQVVAEYASGAAPTSPTEKYVYASYIDEPVLKDGTGGTVYYHRNSQYSVAALTSASGSVVERYGYEPYGELTILAADGSTVRASSSYANTYTYTGRRWDADLSLYYFRARYYDPGLGRFVGRDPAAHNDRGRYEFLKSRPDRELDASGLWCVTRRARTPNRIVQKCKARCKRKGQLLKGTVTFRTDCSACWGWIKWGWQTTKCLCKPKPKCKPCVPPVGTVTHQIHHGHAHGGADPHVHLFTMHQNPNNCRCFWKRTTIPGNTPPAGSRPFPGPAQGGGLR